MRLSSKTRIGLQALYDMAFHCRGRQAQAKEIALRQRIPVRTLEDVLQDLRKAGLIEGQRGPRGGYTLARPPAEITMSQIVRALEGPVERLFALQQQQASTSASGPDTTDVPDLVWRDVVGRIAAVLGETTLGDFVSRAERNGAQRDSGEPPLPATMYFI